MLFVDDTGIYVRGG